MIYLHNNRKLISNFMQFPIELELLFQSPLFIFNKKTIDTTNVINSKTIIVYQIELTPNIDEIMFTLKATKIYPLKMLIINSFLGILTEVKYPPCNYVKS